MPTYKEYLLKPVFRAMIEYEKADKAVESHQLFRRLFEVKYPDTAGAVIYKRLEKAQTELVHKILALVLLWRTFTPDRCVQTTYDGSRRTVGCTGLLSATECGPQQDVTEVF